MVVSSAISSINGVQMALASSDKVLRHGSSSGRVVLMSTGIAGMMFRPDIEYALDKMEIGDRLTLIREPGNPYDP